MVEISELPGADALGTVVQEGDEEMELVDSFVFGSQSWQYNLVSSWTGCLESQLSGPTTLWSARMVLWSAMMVLSENKGMWR